MTCPLRLVFWHPNTSLNTICSRQCINLHVSDSFFFLFSTCLLFFSSLQLSVSRRLIEFMAIGLANSAVSSLFAFQVSSA